MSKLEFTNFLYLYFPEQTAICSHLHCILYNLCISGWMVMDSLARLFKPYLKEEFDWFANSGIFSFEIEFQS